MEREKSKQAFEESKQIFPGGVNSPARAFNAIDMDPPFIDRGKDQYMYDIDGNKYLDYVLSWGPLVLGHADDRVVEALADQASKGTSYGAATVLESRLGKLIRDLYPSIETMRFVNSGTEATMSAIRLARGYTDRDLIIKFDGCYHGHSDSFLIAAGSGIATMGIADSAGVPDALAELTLSLPFNDPEAVSQAFEKHGDNIAAVIIEPIACNMGMIKPQEGYLELLRGLTEKSGALLIFDEVLVGSRVSRGGAQELYGIKPDLTCLGKVIGGGLPVALYGGRQDIMDHIAPNGPVYQAGTLSGNPLAMVAGYETLSNYSQEDFESTSAYVKDLTQGIKDSAQDHGLKIQVPYEGNLFTIFFNEDPVNNYEDSKASDQEVFKYFARRMIDSGIYYPPSQFEVCFVSTKHSKEDLDFTLATIDEIFGEIKEAF